MTTEHQRALRERYPAAPVMPAPSPWRPVGGGPTLVGGLLGMGFAVHPETGRDLVMVVSAGGHGLFDAVTGERIARDHDPDPGTDTPDMSADLTCPGLGPVAGTPVRIAGLFGGGLHSGSGAGWTVSVVSPDRPGDRVILSASGNINTGPPGGTWWHVFHSTHSEFRAAGFSPTGHTLAVATSSDLTPVEHGRP
ncbi:hypothetical protein [Streptomyces sp. SID4982]|uniref:hypothetical protein n=1 Tax=Streptomyces sp. SID4982 TaxID=2690291 RepID=UPI001367A15E|nr:hypothetical protein [Streptomyces sp. SID4982]